MFFRAEAAGHDLHQTASHIEVLATRQDGSFYAIGGVPIDVALREPKFALA